MIFLLNCDTYVANEALFVKKDAEKLDILVPIETSTFKEFRHILEITNSELLLEINDTVYDISGYSILKEYEDLEVYIFDFELESASEYESIKCGKVFRMLLPDGETGLTLRLLYLDDEDCTRLYEIIKVEDFGYRFYDCEFDVETNQFGIERVYEDLDRLIIFEGGN